MAPPEDVKLTREELDTLCKHYDIDKDGKLSESEIVKLIEAFKKDPKGVPAEVSMIMKKYDTDGDGHLSATEVKVLVEDIYHVDKEYRYVGYSAALARAFRYLAFTSDVGEAIRPVAKKAVVNATYGVAASYCMADVCWETYKVSKTGKNEHTGLPMTPLQMAVERSTFQLTASLVIPAVVIHSAVDFAKWGTKRIGRFTKWGPSIFGLSIIPLLPMYLDEPSEKAIEWLFAKYGPWAAKDKRD